MTTKPKLINGRPFYTKRVRIILELTVPTSQEFDVQIYKEAWLKSFQFMKKGLISAPELIQIASILQTKNLPSSGLKAFTNPILFELFEYCSDIIYKFGMKQISLADINNEIPILEKYAEQLK